MRLKSALRRGVAAAVIAGIVVSSGIPAYAGTWNIADGDITVKGASDGSGNYNEVKQGDNEFKKDEGETVITGCHHIFRGYEDICRDLSSLGAQISKQQ